MDENNGKNRHVAPIGMAAPKYLGAPALLDGEDKRAYKALRDQIFGYVKPKDIFEKMFADDIMNLQWELMRWRRLKVALMNTEQQADARHTLIAYAGNPDMQKALEGWAREDAEETENVKQMLAYRGVSMDALAAKMLSRKLNDLERINELERIAEARRTAAMRDLGQHRERFAKTMKSAIKEVEDAEFTEIKSSNADVSPANADVSAADAA